MTDAEQLASFATERLPLRGSKLPEDYFYASLPLCVIDAVWSIGVNFGGVLNVVKRYCDVTGKPRFRKHDAIAEEQETTGELVALLDSFNAGLGENEELGNRAAGTALFDNRQRTAPTNGILKSEAVRLFAKVLSEHGLERLEHALEMLKRSKNDPTVAASLTRAILSIPGQGSGISLAYFWMLAGDENRIKPDTMVLRFLARALERKVQEQEAQALLSDAATILQAEHPQMTPRLLDHIIWKYQRSGPADRVLMFLPLIEAPGFVPYGMREGYPDYDASLIAPLLGLDDVDPYATLPEDPPGVDPRELLRNAREIERATQAQVLRYLAQLLRGERFGDGYIANEFDAGRVLAALNRLHNLATA